MAREPFILPVAIWEGQSLTTRARLRDSDGSLLQQSDFAAASGGSSGAVQEGIRVSVYDLSSATPGTAVHEDDLTVASVIFNTLQTDAGWTRDATGYNFRHTLDGGDILLRGGRRYRVEYELVKSDGSRLYVVNEVDARPVFTR